MPLLKSRPKETLGRMKFRVALIAALGFALATYVFLHIGWDAVLSTVVEVGWRGFTALCLFALALLVLLGGACFVLRPPSSDWKLWVLVWSRMVRDSASEVLPFAQLGGLVLGARAAIFHGVPTPVAFATLIADITTEMLAQIAYVALGLFIFGTQVPKSPVATSLISAVVIGLLLAAVAGVLLLSLPRYADSIIKTLIARFLPDAGAATAAVTTLLNTIYRSRSRVVLAIALHFGGWIASALGAWIAFRLMGARLDFTSVLAIESLVAASRSAAVVIPNALGVQEAAYMVLTPLFGVGAEFGLAVSLLKRARDLVLGIPILLIWQGFEGQRLLRLSRPYRRGSR
jgi:glycosyltransferase 2 family protein